MINDLKYAIRMLAKAPAFTAIVVLTLALGIGANTAIFSVVHAVLLRPLPISEPDRVVQLWESKDHPAGFTGSVSAANLRDWREQNSVFTGIAAYDFKNFALQGKESPERLIGVRASANYFNVMGARPLLGRTFVEGEDQAGRSDVVVISEPLWRAQFAADPAIVGRTITLDNRPLTVIGVMPADFRLPSARNQVWAPLVLTPAEEASRGNHMFMVVARLRPGAAFAEAQAQMATIARGIEQKFPQEQTGRSVKLVPLREQLTRNNRAALLVLLGSVGCVLLIASANIANLLLARTAGRQREIALRLAVGASRGRLVRQFLTESLLLSAVGGMVGVLTAFWATDLLVWLLGNRVAGADVRLDGTVLAFTAALALLVGIGCGLAPGRQVVGKLALDLQTALHGHTQVAGANRMRAFFVVAEMALAVVLLSGAGLLLRSFAQLQRTESGLAQPEQVLTARVSLPAERYANPAAVADFYERTAERLNALRGVRAAGAISHLPIAQWGTSGDIQIVGRDPFPPGQAPLVEFRAVAGDYFATAGVPLIAGRDLDARDGAGAPGAVLINRTLARHVWNSEHEALGAQIKGGDEPVTVVGVVADVRQAGLDRPSRPEMYYSVAQAPNNGQPGGNLAQSGNLVVRASAENPNALIESMRAAVREIDPTLPLFQIQTLNTVISESVADRRLNGVLLGTFAAIALGLAALGLYGVMAYSVTQRTRELGIRVALGAQRGDVSRLVIGGGMKLAAIGCAIGLLAALGLTRLLESLLYGVAPTDPLTFGAVVLLLGIVALLANYIPARRAVRVDPMVALRHE